MCETVRPSPVAVTVNVAEPSTAVGLAVRVRVEDAAPEEGVTGFALQAAVTPLGSPEIARAMFPLKEPPVAKVNKSVALLPCFSVTVLSADVKLSVGAVKVTTSGSAAAVE